MREFLFLGSFICVWRSVVAVAGGSRRPFTWRKNCWKWFATHCFTIRRATQKRPKRTNRSRKGTAASCCPVAGGGRRSRPVPSAVSAPFFPISRRARHLSHVGCHLSRLSPLFFPLATPRWPSVASFHFLVRAGQLAAPLRARCGPRGKMRRAVPSASVRYKSHESACGPPSPPARRRARQLRSSSSSARAPRRQHHQQVHPRSFRSAASSPSFVVLAPAGCWWSAPGDPRPLSADDAEVAALWISAGGARSRGPNTRVLGGSHRCRCAFGRTLASLGRGVRALAAFFKNVVRALVRLGRGYGVKARDTCSARVAALLLRIRKAR